MNARLEPRIVAAKIHGAARGEHGATAGVEAMTPASQGCAIELRLPNMLTINCPYARLCAIVQPRYAKIALFILLIAGALFVVDVLSPATPIPNADDVVNLLIAVFTIVIAVEFSNFVAPETFASGWIAKSATHHRGPRARLVWLRVLLD
jgi:hypothetical protein